jgi:hypothetical protein
MAKQSGMNSGKHRRFDRGETHAARLAGACLIAGWKRPFDDSIRPKVQFNGVDGLGTYTRFTRIGD